MKYYLIFFSESSGHSHYRYGDYDGQGNVTSQNYMFASEFVGLQIRATSPDGTTVVLWDNPYRNSPFGIVPLRQG